MPRYKLTIEYDGTPYVGWQVQDNGPSVQGLLMDAIAAFAGERAAVQGAGRTDAGVHALGQVASFTLAAPIPAANLHNALNRCLPPSIRVLSAEIAPPTFHARHSATAKSYEYRIFPLKPAHLAPRTSNLEPDLICPPILAPYVWPCPWPVSLDLLNRAAAHVLGAHDFTTFAASDPDLTSRTDAEPAPPPIRTITHSAWSTHGGLFIYRVTGSGFLHHMVRNLVGTFVQCGSRRLSPDAIPSLLAARNRSAAGPTAPATGLFLVSVEYSVP